jgi:hypothetical protein
VVLSLVYRFVIHTESILHYFSGSHAFLVKSEWCVCGFFTWCMSWSFLPPHVSFYVQNSYSCIRWYSCLIGGSSGGLFNGISNFDIFRVRILIFLSIFLHQVISAAAAQNGLLVFAVRVISAYFEVVLRYVWYFIVFWVLRSHINWVVAISYFIVFELLWDCNDVLILVEVCNILFDSFNTLLIKYDVNSCVLLFYVFSLCLF